MGSTAAEPASGSEPEHGPEHGPEHDPGNPVARAASGPNDAAELTALRARVAELERERDHLVAVVDIQREIANATTFVDVLQAITRILGGAFALDRCSIYLAGAPGEARLVASYENPAIRNLVVDLERYPELKLAFERGELVFIRDAASDVALAPARDALAMRNVGAIAVVPMRWRGSTIGAIFLRTDRNVGESLSEADLRFCQVVAALAAQALHNAHQGDGPHRLTPYAAPSNAAAASTAAVAAASTERAAVLAFVRRLLDRHAALEASAAGAAALATRTDEELDRLVEVALRVIGDGTRR
jgi:GAF domain-containing protein